VLSDVSLWLRLDLSPAGGVACDAATDALLRTAAARAAGGLRALDVADCVRITHEVVCAVAAQNAGALAELRMGHTTRSPRGFLLPAELEQLLRAAPHLRILNANVSCEGVEEACRLLRKEAQFEMLRARQLVVYGLADADDVVYLTEALPSHAWLTGLSLVGAQQLRLPGALDAVVDTALQLRLTCLQFWECDIGPDSAPALARLLGGSLKTLVFGRRA
jgi:hypothetical protein